MSVPEPEKPDPEDGALPEPSRAEPTAAERELNRRMSYDIIEPVGWRVVIRKDENKRTTKSGIVLPDSHQIPVITGRIVAVSKDIDAEDDPPVRQYEKVLFDPREAVPVELEHDNKLFVVELDRVLAIFRRGDRPQTGEDEPAKPKAEEAEEADDADDGDLDEDDIPFD
jgi:chaperonin GroES